MNIITQDQVREKIIQIRNQNILLDNDVAQLYGVETKRINEAVKRNPKKFPPNYIFYLTREEYKNMRPQFATASKRNTSNTTLGFTEKGLYMLATILKSTRAVETTIAIIDTFTQFKELTQSAYEISKTASNNKKVKIFEKSTDIITDILDNNLVVSEQETNFKLKLPFFEVNRKVTKINDKKN